MHEESFWANPRTWVGVAFVLFVLIFGRKLWAALAKMLDARTAAVRAELDEASRLRREAETMLQQAEAQRSAAIEDAKRLLEGARAEAVRVATAAAHEAEVSAKRREQMAVDRIAAAEKSAVDEVRVTAAEVATEAARSVIRSGFTAQADDALIDDAIRKLPSALASRRAA